MVTKTDIIVDLDYVLKHGDPRVLSYPLMKSPIPTFMICAIYLIFVKVIGPSWMKNKKPFDLNYAMIIYNFGMVALSFWMFYNLASHGWLKNFNWLCEPIDYSRNEDSLKITQVCYIYYLSKIVECLDTIFMVLRKKDSQVSFLHVFHHFFMLIWTYYFVKYSSGGYPTMAPLWNTFVHTVMYTYYGLCAFGPEIQKYIWWKKYITKLQYIQFTWVMAHMIVVLILPLDYCKITYFQALHTFLPAITFFILFIPFYKAQYLTKKEKKPKSSTEELKQT